jgi:PIN domain
VKDPDIRLVLDTSAILAYAATSIHVGETIAEVVDEGGRVGVPVVCLAEASRLIADKLADGVTLLVRHPSCVVLPTLAEDWTALAAWTRVLSRVDLAAALIEATDRPAGYVLSGEPDAYGDDDMPVISI